MYRHIIAIVVLCALTLFAQGAKAQMLIQTPTWDCVNPSVSSADQNGSITTDNNYPTVCNIGWRFSMQWGVPKPNMGPMGAGSPHTAANTFNTANSNNSQNPCPTKVSDPVDVSTGYKTEKYTDFAVPVEMGLRYDRYYVSHFGVGGAGLGDQNGLWTTSLDYILSGTVCYDILNGTSCPPITYIRPDGSSLVFQSVTPTLGSQQGKVLTGPFVSVGTASLTYNGNNTYTLRDEDSNTLVFDANGRVQSIKDASSVGWTFSYPDSKTTIVTHTNGQSMKVAVTSGSLTGSLGSSLETQVTDPAGNVYTYDSYNAPMDDIVTNSPSHIEVLASVVYPGVPGQVDSFNYVMGYYLMTEADYNGIAQQTTSYDSAHRVAKTGLADGTQTSSFSYSSSGSNSSTTVTNPLGHTTVYNFDSNYHLTSIVGQASARCAATNATNTYDANGNMASSTDNNGNVTKYTYASNGLLQQKVEAYGTTVQRVTDYTWDSAESNRPLSVKIEGFSETDYTYDGHNRLASVSVKNLSSDGVANQTLTTSYSYTLYANGMVQTMTVTHPSPNNINVDTYQYDSLGNLTSESDGLGHTTTYTNYNALGEPGHVVGPNGDATDYAYDTRGRTTTKTTYPNGSSAQWSYRYDPFGLLSSVTSPDGEEMFWSRNASGVLQATMHFDKEGESTETYGYDANGDVTSDTITRANTVFLSTTASYDELGRLYQNQGTHGQSQLVAYDANGNVQSVTNATGHVISYSYDALNRVITKTESGGASPAIPGAPSLTVPSTSNSGSYTVAWASAGATTYTLQEQNGASWQTVEYGASVSWTAVGKANGSYTYRVQACNASGCSGWSNTASITVALAPTSSPSLTVPASSANGNYTVSWSSVATSTSYTLQEQFNGGSWSTVQSSAATSLSLSGKASGTYGYRVQACNGNGCGAWSAVASIAVAVPPQAAPSLSVPGANTNGAYTVSWTAVATASSYTLQEQVNGGSWSTVQSSGAASWSTSGRPSGSYSYQVQACNAYGCGPWSTTATTTVTLPPSSAPSLSGGGTSNTGSYAISWATVASATSYVLQEQVNGGGWTTVQSSGSTSWSAGGKTNGTYAYQVQACNAGGCGPWSGTVTMTVTLAPSYSNQSIVMNGTAYPNVMSVNVVSTAPLSSCTYWVTIGYAGASTTANVSAPSLPTGQSVTQSTTQNYSVGGGTFTIVVTGKVLYAAGRYTKTCSATRSGP